jgi:hypothetical protein
MEVRGLWSTDDGTLEGKRTGQRITHLVMEGGAFSRAFARMPSEVLLPFICRTTDPSGQGKEDRSKLKYVTGVHGSKPFWGSPGVVAIDYFTGCLYSSLDASPATELQLDELKLQLFRLVAELSAEGTRKVLEFVEADKSLGCGQAGLGAGEMPKSEAVRGPTGHDLQ